MTRRSTAIAALLVVAALIVIFLTRADRAPRPSTAPPRAAVPPTSVVANAPAVAAPPATESAALVSAKTLAAFNARRTESLWQQTPPEDAFALFSEWAKRYAATGANPDDGVRLASIRRVELAKLIEADPKRALELAVPWSVRRQLPAAVQAQLETSISARGDLTILAAIPAPGEPLGVPTTQWTATVNGQDYNANVYGRRLGHPSRWNVPLHGIALGNQMAVGDSPVRILEAAEAAAVKASLPADPICSISGQVTTVNNEEVALDLGGEYVFLCGPQHAAAREEILAASEDGLPPGNTGGGGGGMTPEYASLGARQIILIRVDFSDYTGASLTDTEATNVVLDFNYAFNEWSYGRFSFDAPGAGSAVTPLYRMSTSAAGYDGNSSQLHTDARNAATADGYNMNNYDFIMVCFRGGTPGFGYGGLGQVGGKNSWIRSTGRSGNANIGSHELGHNFGLNHANFYDAPVGTMIADGGDNQEYGDPYDTLGGASTNNHFNVRFKQYLAWITNDASGTEWVSASGTTTNRLYAHDVFQSPGLLKGIRITRNTGLGDLAYYWLEYRTEDNSWLDRGVGIRWAGSGNQKSQLIDTTPDSPDGKNDSPIFLGRTFSDYEYGIHVTPIARGGSSPAWIDVVVRLGQFAGNQAPTLDLTASATNVSTGQAITFTAAASDPDGDALAYYWDFGDGTLSTNAASLSKSYSSNGERVVQCWATDMKGKLGVASLVVRVGNPSTFRITGEVLFHGQPVADVRVNASSDGDSDLTDDRYTFSNSDGSYSLAALTGTNWTMRALAETGVYIRTSFNNPVPLGPNASNINFGGGFPTNRLFAAGTRQVNMNGTNGPIYFTIYDYESAASNLVVSAVSGNTNLVPAANLTIPASTSTNRSVTIRPAPGATGTVTNYIVVTDPNGLEWSNSIVLQINPPPVLSGTGLSSPEDSGINFDLWGRTTDNNPTATSDSNAVFAVSSGVNGTVTLLTNRTARFQPATNFHGAASFTFTATDRGYDPFLLFYYDFEPTDTPADNASSDRSGNARTGTLDLDGTGDFDYATNDVPAALAPQSLVSLRLFDNGNSNSARLYRAINTTEHNLKNADWSFAAWFKRESTASEDFLFYFGDSDGAGGSVDELELMFIAGSQTLRLRHYNASSNSPDMQLFSSGALPTNQWHHVAVIYDRTNTNIGNLRLYVNGLQTGAASNISLLMPQDLVIIGGHDSTNNTQRWFDGWFDDVALWRRVLTSNEVAELAAGTTVAHFGGLTSTTNIPLTITPVNDAPSLSAVSDSALIAGATLAVSNNATDVDLPGDALAFSLLTAPPDASIDPATGLIGWRPAITNGGTTNLFAVRVADLGNLSATQQFFVTVNAAAVPTVAALSMVAGQLSLQVSGDGGPDYHLFATTNMVDWVTLQTWSNAAAFPLNWTDTNAADFQRRFYEIRLGP
jgi:Concanavalin A-like lectin/glucanases superfamily/PKD domain/Bacterial Ig domain